MCRKVCPHSFGIGKTSLISVYAHR
jgi:hypothetical protein